MFNHHVICDISKQKDKEEKIELPISKVGCVADGNRDVICIGYSI